MKAQVVIDQRSGEICTDYGKGFEHDFKLYKRSLIRIKKEEKCLADKGYQGIKKHHHFSQIPKKRKFCGEGFFPQNFLRQKPRKGKLSVAERIENRELAKERIIIENIFAYLKRFRILQGRYRNRTVF